MKKISNRIIFVIIVIVAFIAIYSNRNASSINKTNVKYLESFGWNVSKGDPSIEHINLRSSWSGDEIYSMKRSASAEIGLDPGEFSNCDINVYMYLLEEIGLKDNLRADIWVYQKKIIGTYVYHVENNISVKFWPINTPLEKIVSEIRDLDFRVRDIVPN